MNAHLEKCHHVAFVIYQQVKSLRLTHTHTVYICISVENTSYEKSVAFLSRVKLTTVWRHLNALTKANFRTDNATHKGSTEMRLSDILASTKKEMGVLRHFLATEPNGQHKLFANQNIFHYTEPLLSALGV